MSARLRRTKRRKKLVENELVKVKEYVESLADNLHQQPTPDLSLLKSLVSEGKDQCGPRDRFLRSANVAYKHPITTDMLGFPIQKLVIKLVGVSTSAVLLRKRGGLSVFLAKVYFVVTNAPDKLGLPDEAIRLLQLMASVSVQPCPSPALHDNLPIEGVAFSTLAMEMFIKLCAHFKIHRSKVITESQVVAAIIAVPKASGVGKPHLVPRVASIATGTKMAEARLLVDSQGNHLLDYHAEVLAVRAFRRWVFQLLTKFGDEVVKNDILGKHTFHLFVNRLPCGDAAFCRTNESGMLRYRQEGGSQATPPSTNEASVADGKLRLMTCSDKMAMWSVCGMQGALLSRIVGTVYLESVTVATTIDSNNPPDAVRVRVEEALIPSKRRRQRTVDGKASPRCPGYGHFEEHRPKVYVVAAYNQQATAAQSADSPTYSINWSSAVSDSLHSGNVFHAFFQPSSSVEIVDTSNGTAIIYSSDEHEESEGQAAGMLRSRLSKAAFASSAKALLRADSSDSYAPVTTYRRMKEKASNYTAAKRKVKQYFTDCQLGEWVRPQEHDLDDFEV